MTKKKLEAEETASPEQAQAEAAEAQSSEAQADSAANEDQASAESTENPSGDTKLREERDALQVQLQRTLADLQNFRKRRAQEMADIRKATVEAMTSELLPVLDNFHLATNVGEATGEDAINAMRDGIQMIRGMVESVFQRHGVQEIEAEGVKFDPNVHEAVGIDPDPEAEEGQVTQIIQKGYEIDGKIIRPSRVMVGGAPPVAAEEDK